MNPPRVLIAGIGNIFLGDDAFGVEVAQRLANVPLPDGVCVKDFGIRGLDLTYALLDGYDLAILVDAVPRGQAPGTVYLIEPEIPATSASAQEEFGASPMFDGHSMDPVRVLRAVAALGGKVDRLLLVGCEPTPLNDSADMQNGLSPAVAAAVPRAIEMIESILESMTTPSTSQISPLLDAGTVAKQIVLAKGLEVS
jgi:hydrogenase maturation protease